MGGAAFAAEAPVLRIDVTSPEEGSRRPWQGQVSYSVTVMYDGKSTRFGEIQPNDVVLETRFLTDVKAAPQIERDLPDALRIVSQSNCSGCHDFDARGAGPSYAAISARYATKPAAAATLALHITRGSSGAWGAAAMPPHPDITDTQARAVADWILGHGTDDGVHYHLGHTGSFRMIPVGHPGPRAGIVATAYYTGPLKSGDTRRFGAGVDRVVITGVAQP